MLTGMTDIDWATVLEVFGAWRTRRGANRDDRMFLEALHSSQSTTSPGGRCRASMEIGIASGSGFGGSANPACSKPSLSPGRGQQYRAFGSDVRLTVVRAHVSAAGAKGGRMAGARALARGLLDQDPPQGRSDGRPLAFHLTEGEASDSPQFEILATSGPTSRLAPRWVTRDTTARPIARRRKRGIRPISRSVSPRTGQLFSQGTL